MRQCSENTSMPFPWNKSPYWRSLSNQDSEKQTKSISKLTQQIKQKKFNPQTVPFKMKKYLKFIAPDQVLKNFKNYVQQSSRNPQCGINQLNSFISDQKNQNYSISDKKIEQFFNLQVEGKIISLKNFNLLNQDLSIEIRNNKSFIMPQIKGQLQLMEDLKKYICAGRNSHSGGFLLYLGINQVQMELAKQCLLDANRNVLPFPLQSQTIHQEQIQIKEGNQQEIKKFIYIIKIYPISTWITSFVEKGRIFVSKGCQIVELKEKQIYKYILQKYQTFNKESEEFRTDFNLQKGYLFIDCTMMRIINIRSDQMQIIMKIKNKFYQQYPRTQIYLKEENNNAYFWGNKIVKFRNLCQKEKQIKPSNTLITGYFKINKYQLNSEEYLSDKKQVLKEKLLYLGKEQNYDFYRLKYDENEFNGYIETVESMNNFLDKYRVQWINPKALESVILGKIE